MGAMSSAEQSIANLVFRYARLMDAGDFDGVAALFERGTYVGMPGGPPLADLLRQTVLLHDGQMGTHHVTTNLEIELDDDAQGATARSYFSVFQQIGEFPLQPIICGRYTDRMVLGTDGWHFAERKIDMTLKGDLSHHLSYRP